MQATFGPTLEKIHWFPNVYSDNFIDEDYTNFEAWIDQQIMINPFYHRAYWRQRSDPDYIDKSDQSGCFSEMRLDMILR